MRLGQLTRKLALRPGQIVEFLAKNQILIEDGSNTRLEDEHVLLVTRHFAPLGIEEANEEQEEQEEAPLAIVASLENPSDLIPTSVSNSTPESETTIGLGEKSEVIKAPKVELPGLKVVGKIEFPEPRKKEPIQPETPGTNDPEKERRDPDSRKGKQVRTERRDIRPRKNPIALERERQASEAEKRRKAEAELKKELRTKHYLNKVKPSAPTKAVKIVDEPLEEMQEERPRPKTQLGRFLRWLTT